MLSVCMYAVEELRQEFIHQVRTHGSLVGVCIKLGISEQAFYKCQAKRMDLPWKVQRMLGVRKVMDGNTVVGYVSMGGEVRWEDVWK